MKMKFNRGIFVLLAILPCHLIAQKVHKESDPPVEYKIVDAATNQVLDSVQAVLFVYNRRGKILRIPKIACNKTYTVKGKESFPEYFIKEGYEAAGLPVQPTGCFSNFVPFDPFTIKMKKKP
jgi:hypothetical protein